MKGLENAIRNLNSLDTRMVPQASAWAINRVAQKAVSVATRQVAGNTVAGDNLANGRWHVLRRLPEARFATGHDHQGRPRKNRLPVEVVKIPLSGPLTQAFEDARDHIIAAEMPKQLGYALKQQLRLWLTR